jgi:translation initiation factor IF-2
MAKKYKLFKVAKELNLSSETLTPFLEEKGVEVKGVNTSFSEEIYEELLVKYAKEKEKADELVDRKKEKEKELAEQAEEVVVVPEQQIVEKNGVSIPVESFIEEKIRKEEDKARKREEERKQAEADAERERQRVEKQKAKLAEMQAKEEADRRIAAEREKEEQVKKEQEAAASKATAPAVQPAATPEKDDRPKRPKLKGGRKERGGGGKIAVPVDPDAVESPKSGRRKKRKKQVVVDQSEVDSNVKKTLAQMGSGQAKKRKKKIKRQNEEGIVEEIEQNVISVTEFISAQDLAGLMDVPVNDILAKAIGLGLMITINQRLDLDSIELLASEFEFAIEVEEEYASQESIDVEEEEDKPEDLQPRPPVVTIMGHVDHGKTSLLDHIRKTNVVDSESGGITQHIGAYQVNSNGRVITFLDTPGHEAFTAMRARGAQVTDVAIIVVAADDAVMPQTIEAIDHAKSAGVKIVIAVNKMDKAGANPDRIYQQLSDRNLMVEEWGGDVQVAKVSAKTGEGIDELLEKVLLEAELLELKSNPDRHARGVIIEARLDRGKGAMATVLVQRGTLHVGDSFVAGQYAGKVRAMYNDRGEDTENAGPAAPVQVLGFDATPQAGDLLNVMADDRAARNISSKRQQIKREQDFRKHHYLTLDEISRRIQHGEVKELNIIVKADVDGSVEALSDSLMRMSNDEVAVQVVRKAVGQISEADVMLAAASNAIIIGFHVRPSGKARELAGSEKVDIRTYKVVYDAINDIRQALEGMLSPEVKEQIIGHVEIRQVFKVSKVGSIAGCYVTDGRITRNNPIRLIRDGIVVFEGKLNSLKRFQDDAAEVKSGFECGLQIAGYNDIKEGDEIEVYETFEEKRTLA